MGGVLPQVLSMIRTRLELVALDVEAHVRATMTAMLVSVIAVVIALMALAFVGVAVIVAFWDSHRILSALGVLAVYAGFALGAALHARARWRSRPSAFDATLRELELDRAIFRRDS